jgi:hypothetical protein
MTFGNTILVSRMRSLLIYQETKTWNLLQNEGSPPLARHFHTAAVYAGSMYIFGGFAAKMNRNDLYRYCFGRSSDKEGN